MCLFETAGLKRKRGKGKGKKRGVESEEINGLQRKGRSERGSKRGEDRVLGGVWILEAGRISLSTSELRGWRGALGPAKPAQPVGTVDGDGGIRGRGQAVIERQGLVHGRVW